MDERDALRSSGRPDHDEPVQDQEIREEAQEDAGLRGVVVGGALGGSPGMAAGGLIGGAALGVRDESDEPTEIPVDAEDPARPTP